MGVILDTATEFMDRRLPRAMEALGITAAGAVSASIDTPYPPASTPGTPPHKRTGNLQAGIDHRESGNGDDFATTITSSRAEGDPRVPQHLEFGTSKMAPRPYMRPVMNQAPRMVPETMRRSFSSEATHAAAG